MQPTELYTYTPTGELITAQELLQRELGHYVTEDEALNIVRRNRFITNLQHYAKNR